MPGHGRDHRVRSDRFPRARHTQAFHSRNASRKTRKRCRSSLRSEYGSAWCPSQCHRTSRESRKFRRPHQGSAFRIIRRNRRWTSQGHRTSRQLMKVHTRARAESTNMSDTSLRFGSSRKIGDNVHDMPQERVQSRMAEQTVALSDSGDATVVTKATPRLTRATVAVQPTAPVTRATVAIMATISVTRTTVTMIATLPMRKESRSSRRP